MRGRPARISWGLQRHAIAEILKVLLFVLGVLELTYALFIAVGVARDYDLDLLLVLPVFWTTGLGMLKDALPLSLLFATSLVYGRLTADREVTAMKSFGLSYFQLLLPALLLGLLFAPLGFAVNGYLVPEMSHQRRNIGRLLLAQLRYLGEGRNRDFPFGDKTLWIRYHNGRELAGIFLSTRGEEAPDLLPPGVAQRIHTLGKPLYLFAERGRILFPEDLEERGGASDGPAREAVVIELENINIFVKDEILSKPEVPNNFMQRLQIQRHRIPYDPAGGATSRRRRHLLEHDLLREVERTRARGDAHNYRVSSTEVHGRRAWTLSLLTYPLFAAMVALFLNSENRLLPFFAATLAAPVVFYGLASLGRIVAMDGGPAWLVMELGNLALLGAGVAGYLLLERKVLR